jgi:hypothetical protein
MTRVAQCGCGAASISVDGEPRMHALCHCSDCKRRTGSAFAVSTYFLKANVVGRTGDFLVYSAKRRDDDQEAHFCRTCGTTLFWFTGAKPHLIGIPAGCFPDNSLGAPTVSAKTGEKLPWVGLPDSWKFI